MHNLLEVPKCFWQQFRQSDLVYYFLRDKVAIASFTIFAFLVFIALLSPWIAPSNPYDLGNIDIMNSELPPAWLNGGDSQFILGTDPQGRNILSVLLYGIRVSLTIGICAVFLQVALGITIGLFAGYFGGRIDALLMRLADVKLSFSTMMVAIIISVIFKTLFGNAFYGEYALVMLVVVIGVAEWPQYARTVRAQVLAEKKKEYVQAARIMGFRVPRILFRHILPNCLAPVLVISTVQMANAIMSEAALSFFGLGLPPGQPSLGTLIHVGFNHIFSGAWWITAFPGVVLVILILVINLLGDWLRDVLNPKIYKN